MNNQQYCTIFYLYKPNICSIKSVFPIFLSWPLRVLINIDLFTIIKQQQLDYWALCAATKKPTNKITRNKHTFFRHHAKLFSQLGFRNLPPCSGSRKRRSKFAASFEQIIISVDDPCSWFCQYENHELLLCSTSFLLGRAGWHWIEFTFLVSIWTVVGWFAHDGSTYLRFCVRVICKWKLQEKF